MTIFVGPNYHSSPRPSPETDAKEKQEIAIAEKFIIDLLKRENRPLNRNEIFDARVFVRAGSESAGGQCNLLPFCLLSHSIVVPDNQLCNLTALCTI